ncbi:hypothetical protein CsatA_030756 [Cannabis sativa]
MLTNLLGTATLLSLLGGFISDTYLTRFATTLIFASIELMGYIVLLVQAHRSDLRPPKCLSITHQCEGASAGEAAILYTGLYLMALGTGGVKAALPALGADQFDPKKAKQLSSYFNWFIFSLTIGSILGVTLVVWISTDKGWDWAFAVCAIALLLSIFFISLGNPFYRNNLPKGSPLLRFLRVFVASFRNRKLPIPENADELHEIYQGKEDDNLHHEILQRTDQFKFLDRAAVIRRTEDDDNDGSNSGSEWRVFPAIPLLFMFILIPLYDRVFVPIARRVTGIPTGISHLQRIGIGLVLSAISMTVAGFVEKKRRNVAIQHDMVDSQDALPISVFWLGYQYAIFGAADMFTLVGMLEFFYAESSAGMKALSTAISWCSLAFGYYLSSVVVEIVNKVSGGWLANNNLNRDKLENFYWLLAGLSVVNFGVYVMCASWYKYKNVEMIKKDDAST